ncbi:prolyl oligopeptidase family serine peptidase [Arcticibacter tournemirensis]|uniref:Prolyl oligopeptidase family serine peptidase n=1 Tax=Arcticibacter tournemirensis TaxID=699437 RepID=A0A5M9HDA0_9SPHI|nr:S9 family peptidase [Arcticibacter tournemirensis]KAA8484439.1 prolyl oligopeptidase family serine peptidase [Arcticibacter tournemirensis]
MIRFFLLFVSFSFCAPAFAQQKQFTMEEAVLGMNTSLAREDLKQLNWIPGENSISEVVKTPYGGALVRRKLPQISTDTLLRLSELQKQLGSKYTLRALPPIEWIDNKEAFFALGNNYFICSAAANGWNIKEWRDLPGEAENVVLQKSTKRFAYTIGNNLYLIDAAGKTHTVTSDKEAGIVNGRSVHRNEFGIDGGIFLSPKGNYLAFYRMDERMVEDYPIVNWNVTPAAVHLTKYPFAGRTSHEVTLGVYNPSSGKTIFLDTGTPKDHYLTSVTWSPDEQFIYLAILNREQNHLWLNQYNARTGAFIKTLFEETDPKYVHPQHSLTFIPGKNDEFIWWSQRDGFMHLYRYNTRGKLLNQITKGDWVVTEIAGESEKRKELYIISTKESPLDRHIYSVNWESGKLRRLGSDPGTHSAGVSTTGDYVIDRWSNGNAPRVIDMVSTTGKWKQNLLTAKDPLAAYQRPKIENVTIKADDGTPLYGKLIYPVNFDATKKYPVIVYLYNGPNVQIISNGFPASGNLWYEYMAQHGYVIFTMEGRGSANRGMKFEQATFRKLGTVEMEDQLKGVAYLKSLPFVDASRLGVHGWSYGGFMTTSLMLRHPEVFKCGVAGGPVMDWKMYEVMYTERYMDTPQENPEGYEEANLLTKVKNLKGKLLLIHGTIDSTVVWQHSVNFVKQCVDNNVQVDYFVYPGYEHNVRGRDRVHLMQKITDYFDEYLK